MKNDEGKNADNLKLLSQLEKMLVEQIACAKRSELGTLETLSNRTNELVRRMTRQGIVGSPEFAERCPVLEKLYNELRLVISAEQSQTGRELGRLRKHKKALGGYRASEAKTEINGQMY